MHRPLLIASLFLTAGIAAALWWSIDSHAENVLRIGPNHLEFSNVRVGERERRALIATNVSDESIQIDEIVVAAPFRTSRTQLELAAGESREVMVTFEPTASGNFPGRVEFIGDSIPGGALEVSLQGSALQPAHISVEPLALDFGQVGLGKSSRARITVTNGGEDELRVFGMSGGKGFRTEINELVVPANGRESIEIVFAPEDLRDYRRSLILRSNDPEQQRIAVKLEGTGVEDVPAPEIAVDPSLLDFATAGDCSGGKKWVSIANYGKDPLDISQISIPAPFSGASRSRSVPPGQRFRFPVFYVPNGPSGHAETLSIFSNDPNREAVSVALQGAGSSSRCVATADAVRGPLDAEDGRAGSSLGPLAGGGGSSRTARADGDDPTLPLDPTDSGDPDDAPTPDAIPAPGLVEGGESLVRVGSYTSTLSDFHVEDIAFDSNSGMLTLNNVRLPGIDAALGEYFQFEVVPSVTARVDALGEAQTVLPVTMYDLWGNPTVVELTLTTGVASALLDGQIVTANGQPLESGKIVLVGLARFDEGPFAGSQIRVGVSIDGIETN